MLNKKITTKIIYIDKQQKQRITSKTMKTVKTKRKVPLTKQVGLRLNIRLADEIRDLAKADERDLTYVLTKIIEIGLPIFKERSQQKANAA